MDSLQESSQLALPLLERRGMLIHISMCVKDYDGKGFDHDKKVVFSDLLHSFSMFLQDKTPKGSERSHEYHSLLGPNENSEHGHSLDVQREIPFHDGCFPKAPNLCNTFNHVKVTYATRVWWECHLPHQDLMKTRGGLCWHHMWDFDPPPQVQISVCIYVVLIQYIDDIVVLFMGLYG